MLRPTPPGWRSRARRATLLILALIAFAPAAAPSTADAAEGLPQQGMYDSCDPVTSRDHCQSRLRVLSAAGFKVVQKMGGVTVEQLPHLLIYANSARALGLKVIWQLRTKTGVPDASMIAAVTTLRLLPATWGYYIFDEPSRDQRDIVAAFAARVKALDPHHPRLIMGCGNCYGGEGSVDFLAGVDATLGTDIYPVWEQAPNQSVVARKVTAAAAGLRRVADREGRQTVMALQAFRWGDSHYDSEATGIGPASRFPTQQEIEDQRNAAIAAGHPDLILWFTLNQVIGWEPGQRPWYWAQPSDAAQRWANLTRGAFAPLPQAANKRPVPRITLRAGVASRRAQASSSANRRLTINGARSYDPDGRIVRYRWYISGKRGPACGRKRCSLKLRRPGRRSVRLVVTDDRGGRSWTTRRVTVR